jgi:hypothetical protein
MRFKTLLTLAAFALVTCATARAQDQQKEQQVIDDFVTTRGVSFDDPGKKAQPQKHAPQPAAPHRTNSAASAKSSGANSPAGSVASNKSSGGKSNASTKSQKNDATQPGKASDLTAQADGAGVQTLNASVTLRPIAVGYSILMKDDGGGLSFVDPARVFKTGDRIAIALETNASGYLYMFNASDGKNPELLFPNVQIDDGTNALQAHARATFPTGTGADEQYFLNFTDPPATEHLYVVFSREPLAGIPTGEALARFCGTNRNDCVWKPSAALWERIRTGANGRGITEAKNTQLAQAGPQPVMPNTLQRGLKVKKDDPKPAIVRVNESSDTNILVTEIVLAHK